MVLDALSFEQPESIAAFNEILVQLKSSPNLLIRLLASCIWAQYVGEELQLQVVEGEVPLIYSFDLPSLSLHRTEEAVARRSDSVVLMQDPALKLRPLDIEARYVAKLAEIPEANVYYQAVKYFHQLQRQRSWLAGDEELDQHRIGQFLHRIGLTHTFQKPHVAIARQALAHVCAELYDGDYFPSSALSQLPQILVYHDPAFIRNQPMQRPACIASMGGISISRSSFIQFPENWLETAQDSLPLLNSRISDHRIILGEWTQLKYLYDKSPSEERISVIRAIDHEHLWDGLDVEAGHPPFCRLMQPQVDEYLFLDAALDHLIISGTGYGFDTPGLPWIAFNPAVAQELGWHPLDRNWFCWANAVGDLVIESIWWNDGPSHQHSERLSCEVGSGWLVLATEQGFKEIRQWARQLSRGGVTRRWLGQHRRDDESSAIAALALF